MCSIFLFIRKSKNKFDSFGLCGFNLIQLESDFDLKKKIENFLIKEKMKTKLITLTWRGCASVDPRFSASMLSWSIADIRTREYSTRVSFINYCIFICI